MDRRVPNGAAVMVEEQRPYHTFAGIFPLLKGEEYEALRNDIAVNGLIEPILIDNEGAIIDGRNRHRACLDLGIAPRFKTWRGDGSLIALVVGLNLHRRHLSSSQRAAIAQDVLPMLEEEARERQAHGQTAPGKTLQEKIPEALGQSRDHAAQLFGTNGKYVDHAKKLSQEAPDILEDVKAGKLGIPYAMRKLGERKSEERKKERTKKAPVKDKQAPLLVVGEATCLDLADESIDIIITSPPYNLGGDAWPMGGHGREERQAGIGYDDQMLDDTYQGWQLEVFAELCRVARPGASLFYNHKTRTLDGRLHHPMDWLRLVEGWTLRQEIIWDREVTHNHSKTLFWPIDERIYWFTKGRPRIGPDAVGMPTVWRFHGPEPHTWHPAPFPDELPRRCLQAVGWPGAVVLDPFAGSCTTPRVASALGYRAIGVDINGDYLQEASEHNGWS